MWEKCVSKWSRALRGRGCSACLGGPFDGFHPVYPLQRSIGMFGNIDVTKDSRRSSEPYSPGFFWGHPIQCESISAVKPQSDSDTKTRSEMV